MARLLNWPRGLARIGYQRLSGPRSEGAVSTESTTGNVQTVASPFGAWRYQITMPAMRGPRYRSYRSMATGLHGGANAVRVPFIDPDGLTLRESGVDVGATETAVSVPCSNGQLCSNGMFFATSRPIVAVAVDAPAGATTVKLGSEYWGHVLDGGWIGFLPFHLGKYEITEVISPGYYRIWPQLRVALRAGQSYATLSPVMAMRPEQEASATVQRGRFFADGNSLTMIEVQDPDVRSYFAD